MKTLILSILLFFVFAPALNADAPVDAPDVPEEIITPENVKALTNEVIPEVLPVQPPNPDLPEYAAVVDRITVDGKALVAYNDYDHLMIQITQPGQNLVTQTLEMTRPPEPPQVKDMHNPSGGWGIQGRFSPSGKFLVYQRMFLIHPEEGSAPERYLRLWNVETQRLVVIGQAGWWMTWHVVPDTDMLLVSHQERPGGFLDPVPFLDRLELWDLQTGLISRSFEIASDVDCCWRLLYFLPTDSSVILRAERRYLQTIDLDTGRLLKQFTLPEDEQVRWVRFLPDNSHIMVETNQSLYRINLHHGTIHRLFQVDANTIIWRVMYGADARYVAVMTYDSLYLVDLTQPQQGRSIYRQKEPRYYNNLKDLQFSADGRLLYLMTDAALSIFEVQTGRMLKRIRDDDEFAALDLDPAGRYFITLHWHFNGSYFEDVRYRWSIASD